MSSEKARPACGNTAGLGTKTSPLSEKQVEDSLPRTETYLQQKYRLRGGDWVWSGSQFVIVAPTEEGTCPSCVAPGCDVMATSTKRLANEYGPDYRAVDNAYYTRRAAERRTESPYRIPESAR